MSAQPRVLAVDDEELIRMSLRYALAREGYEVDTASCGSEARDLLSKGHYDLILLDLQLPDVNGMDILAFAHDAAPNAKVFLITASSNAPSPNEARRCGVAGVFCKPFKLSEVAAESRRILLGRASPTAP